MAIEYCLSTKDGSICGHIMTKPTITVVVLSTLCIVVFKVNVWAYDNELTHPFINETAVEEKSDLDGVLKNSLGFEEGVDKKINGKKILQWIKDGGEEEDKPSSRCARHFHDPLENWDDAGLTVLLLSKQQFPGHLHYLFKCFHGVDTSSSKSGRVRYGVRLSRFTERRRASMETGRFSSDSSQ